MANKLASLGLAAALTGAVGCTKQEKIPELATNHNVVRVDRGSRKLVRQTSENVYFFMSVNHDTWATPFAANYRVHFDRAPSVTHPTSGKANSRETDAIIADLNQLTSELFLKLQQGDNVLNDTNKVVGIIANAGKIDGGASPEAFYKDQQSWRPQNKDTANVDIASRRIDTIVRLWSTILSEKGVKLDVTPGVKKNPREMQLSNEEVGQLVNLVPASEATDVGIMRLIAEFNTKIDSLSASDRAVLQKILEEKRIAHFDITGHIINTNMSHDLNWGRVVGTLIAIVAAMGMVALIARKKKSVQ